MHYGYWLRWSLSPWPARDVDAVLRADAPIVLGLAAGVLTIDAVAPAVVMDGDIAALRAIFEAPCATAEL